MSLFVYPQATGGFRWMCKFTTSKRERKHLSLSRWTAGRRCPIQQNLFLQDLFFHCRWSFAHVFFPLVQGQRLIGLQVLHKAAALHAPGFTSDFARWRKEGLVWRQCLRKTSATWDAAVSAPRQVGVRPDLGPHCGVTMWFTDNAATCPVLCHHRLQTFLQRICR